MNKLDLPPDFTRPFSLIGKLPVELTDWFAKKGTVTTRSIRDGKVAMLFLPIKPSPEKIWLGFAIPNHEIDDGDIVAVTQFFLHHHDRLVKQIAEYQAAADASSEGKPTPMDGLTMVSMGEFLRANVPYFRSRIKTNHDYRLDKVLAIPLTPGVKIKFPTGPVAKGNPEDYLAYTAAFVRPFEPPLPTKASLETLLQLTFSQNPKTSEAAYTKLTAELLRMKVSKIKPKD